MKKKPKQETTFEQIDQTNPVTKGSTALVFKQETPEAAAEKYLQEWRLVNNIHLSNVIHAERCKNDFIAGVKWQQERN